MRGRWLGYLLVVASLAPFAACGDDDGGGARTFTEPVMLSHAEVRIVERARAEVRSYCRVRLNAIAAGRSPDPRARARATAAIERLAELARAKPEAEVGDGSSVRLALGDIAEDLEGTNCDPDLVELIHERLAELPPP